MILLDIVTAKLNFHNKWLYLFAFPVLTRYKQLPTIRENFGRRRSGTSRPAGSDASQPPDVNARIDPQAIVEIVQQAGQTFILEKRLPGQPADSAGDKQGNTGVCWGARCTATRVRDRQTSFCFAVN